MKSASIIIAGALLAAGTSAFARDSSEQIPAPTIEMRAAGAAPTPIAVVTSSQIPAPSIEVVPQGQPTASYDSFSVDARGNAQYDEAQAARERSAPSVTLVR